MIDEESFELHKVVVVSYKIIQLQLANIGVH